MSVIKRRLKKNYKILGLIILRLALRRVRLVYAEQCLRRAPRTTRTVNRAHSGAFVNQVAWLLNEGEDKDFLQFCGMRFREFQLFYDCVQPYMTQRSMRATRFSLTLKEQVLITLSYLREGKTMSCLSFTWMMSRQSIARSVWLVCSAVIAAIGTEYDCRPKCPEDWLNIANRFKVRWQFPHCLGAVDGKHCAITRFGKSNTQTQNYKKFPSIILLAVVDADYRIIHFNVGAPGARSDGGVWKEDNLGRKIARNEIELPTPSYLPGDPEGLLGEIGYFFVGDDAFTLSRSMMKPFSGRSLNKSKMYFNSRLSRARNVVECVFGHLARRFRIINKLTTEEDMTVKILRAICHIHNFLRLQRMDDPTDAEEIKESIDYACGSPLLKDIAEDHVNGKELQEKLRRYYHLTVFDRKGGNSTPGRSRK